MAKIDTSDIIGNKIGRLTVIRCTGRAGNFGHYHYECSCECGNTKVVARTSLLQSLTKSCGCLRIESRIKHNGSHDNAYWSWKAMHRRCYNKSHDSYPRYGGRGISVCDRWHDYKNFKQDMGEREKGMSIDRIDPNGDYTPENCRWATAKQQSNNRSYNRLVEYKGKVYTCAQLANEYGVDSGVLNRRIFAMGWHIEEALGLKERHRDSRLRDSKGRYIKGRKNI